jgi:hypothetical protein
MRFKSPHHKWLSLASATPLSDQYFMEMRCCCPSARGIVLVAMGFGTTSFHQRYESFDYRINSGNVGTMRSILTVLVRICTKIRVSMYAASLCSLNRRKDESYTLTIAGLKSPLGEAAPVLILLLIHWWRAKKS